MRKLNLLIVALLLTSGLAAQEVKHNDLSLNWGVGSIMRQDQTVSPFIHQKWSPVNIMLRYSRSQKLDQLADIKFSLYNPSIVKPYNFNSYYSGAQTGLAHSFKLIDFNYAIGKPILNKNEWRFVIGGKSRNHIYFSDYNFGPTTTPSPMFISFGLDLWLNLQYRINEKQYIKSNFSLPLFSYIYRAPYLAQNDEYFENIYSHKGLKEFTSRLSDGQIQSWGASQRVDFDLQYGYILNEKWDIGLTYLFAMNLNQSPTKYSQIESVFYLCGKLKF
ncbi:hypothetical protein [Reichenbachiella ulvae]|uniref:DUF2490 domain-containing protein n=1 Tax=Reichenbachiella ulvae TaxID=2980104 RepID=A0ABT3CTE1_9BACT|nr:hypothetical protein [Reichenbachiella ulvae]MCV9386980.1 hypothetical protein [Reichenbachiella ulvae]